MTTNQLGNVLGALYENYIISIDHYGFSDEKPRALPTVVAQLSIQCTIILTRRKAICDLNANQCLLLKQNQGIVKCYV